MKEIKRNGEERGETKARERQTRHVAARARDKLTGEARMQIDRAVIGSIHAVDVCGLL